MPTWFQNLTARLKPEAAHLATGKWGEQQAAKYLKDKGYRILGKRIRVGRRDELDLVAQLGPTLVFVEVKTRSKRSAFRPASAVDQRKQKALTRAAGNYLSQLKVKPDAVRFDVIEVIGEKGSEPEIHHLEQAFKMSSFRGMKWS